MSSLRRDLLERRLWPVVLLLVVAVVAVPFVLAARGKSAATAPAGSPVPVPASATVPTTTTSQAMAVAVKEFVSRHSSDRDPFAGTATSATSTTTTTPTSTSPSSDASTGTAPAGTTVPALSSTPSFASATTSSSAATTTTATTTTSPSTSPSSAPGTTTAASTTSTSPAKSLNATTVVAESRHADSTWNIYSVDARMQTPQGTTSRITNLARLTPLPSAGWPKVMYLGTTDHGREAVFALGTGVIAAGPADCRPAHDDCSAIELPAGRTERVSWTIGDGTQRTLELTVTHIASNVSHAHDAAQAAIARHSQIGLCELQLGEPMRYSYDTATGQLTPTTTSACTKTMRASAVRFPGALTEAGQ